jgi:hypothetical protein
MRSSVCAMNLGLCDGVDRIVGGVRGRERQGGDAAESASLIVQQESRPVRPPFLLDDQLDGAPS